MAKSTKPRNSEFLAERRKVIVEMAKRRRQKNLLNAVNRSAKVASRVSLATSPPPPQN